MEQTWCKGHCYKRDPVQDQTKILEFIEILVFVKGGKLENTEKHLQGKDKSQQQTQTTFDPM